MIFTTSRLLVVLSTLVASASLSAQIVIYSETSEGMSTSAAPTGWVETGSTSNAQVATNPFPAGIDTSSNALTFTSSGFGNEIATTAIDITSYSPSSYTFTLTFDLLASSTTDHGGLFGITTGETHATNPGIRIISAATSGYSLSPNPGGLDLVSGNTWETFSFDITSYVSEYLTDFIGDGAQLTTDFRLAFQSHTDGASALPYFDNITLTVTAVPEPSTYAAIFGGLALIGATIVRRRKSTASTS